MRPGALSLLLLVVLCGCGDGLVEPSGFDGGPPPLPAGDTFLDARLAGCPTPQELASVADHKIIFDTTATGGPLVCRASEGSADLTYPQKRVYWALIVMKELRFDAPLPWTPKPLYDWHRDAVNGVKIVAGSGTSNCCGPDRIALMFVNATSSEPLKWPSIQQFLQLMIHEIRHAEVGGHVCGRWDNRVSDMGPYGVANLFMTWVAEHSDASVIPIEYRAYANYTACVQRGTEFCREPHQTCR